MIIESLRLAEFEVAGAALTWRSLECYARILKMWFIIIKRSHWLPKNFTLCVEIDFELNFYQSPVTGESLPDRCFSNLLFAAFFGCESPSLGWLFEDVSAGTVEGE